jgi:hypothetical protein
MGNVTVAPAVARNRRLDERPANMATPDPEPGPGYSNEFGSRHGRGARG